MAGVAAAALMGLATPASAHRALLKGWTSCSNGEHVVLWSIGNDFELPMTIDSATAAIGATSYAVTGYDATVANVGTTSATTIVPGGEAGTLTLTVHATWTDQYTDTEHASVDLESDCTSTTTTLGSTTTTTAMPTTTAKITNAVSWVS